jgi:hypothetical protein
MRLFVSMFPWFTEVIAKLRVVSTEVATEESRIALQLFDLNMTEGDSTSGVRL